MDVHKIKSLQFYTKKLKLLYVEDNTETRTSTLSLLERFFDDIVVAIDGEDGFNKFKQFNPDIVFTDINMPKVDGLKMMNMINDTTEEKIPILVFSAHDESSYLLRAIKSGVDGYLIKPVEIEKFIEELYRVMREKYKAQNDIIKINTNYTWNKKTKKLYCMSEEITLTKNEILLFELMTLNVSIVYSNELILEQVWTNSLEANGSNIKNLFKRLNDKLPQKLIKNIYSVGYSFI